MSRSLRVLHLLLVLRSSNGQYNEHALPVADERDITLCTYFEPQLTPPPTMTLFAGDGTLRGFFRALKAALDAGEYDAIQAHSPHVSVLFLVGLARWRLKRIRRHTVFLVNDSYHDFKLRNKLLLFLTLLFFHRIVFCGRAARDSYPRWWLRIVGRRARIIRNGADVERIDAALERLTTPPPGPFTVLSIGRFEEVKDPMTLIDAFERGADETARLVMVGDGSLRPVVEGEVRSRGLEDRVTLTGQIERDDVFGWCLAADVFISTSHGEGLPVAVIEAMTTRLPVVLSDIPPHRELAVMPDVVRLVTVGDSEGFARELSRIQLLTESERRSLGELCRSIVVDGFSLEQMTEQYGRLHQELRERAASTV